MWIQAYAKYWHSDREKKESSCLKHALLNPLLKPTPPKKNPEKGTWVLINWETYWLEEASLLFSSKLSWNPVLSHSLAIFSSYCFSIVILCVCVCLCVCVVENLESLWKKEAITSQSGFGVYF